MCRFCHAPLLQRLARLTPARLLPMLVLCLRCLRFLRLLLLPRTLLLLSRPWGSRGQTRASEFVWSGAGQKWAYGLCPFFRYLAFLSHRMDPVQRLMHWAMVVTCDAPAHDNGAGLALAYTHGSAVSDALGPEASARIAADIMAIAQGVASTQADLEILRNGAEVKSERRVSDHETLEAHFTRLNSAINARFIEFDDRIFRMNESRAGSISVQLQETIRTIKRYPDALHEIYLQISNAYRWLRDSRYLKLIRALLEAPPAKAWEAALAWFPTTVLLRNTGSSLRLSLEDVAEGLMAEMSLGEFKERYGEHSAIAALAVIVEDEANDKKQIIHNATGHKLRSPGAREKKRLLREQQKKGDTARSEGARLPWLPGAGEVLSASAGLDPAEWLSASEIRHTDQTIMPHTPMTNEGPETPAGPPLAADNDEESRSEEVGDDELQSEEEPEPAPDAEEDRSLWPIAMHPCPTCGTKFPAGLHLCHSCAKPIHYPDGMFYADQKEIFGVEYYGVRAEWLCDAITSRDSDQYRLHTFKILRNYPISRSLVEDHRRPAFFGVSVIQCASVDLTEGEIELFKKSVRGTLQGTIRVDVSVERLVAGLPGKDSTMSVEEFFRSNTSGSVADTVTKHYGSLFLNCREKPLCFYAQWSVHCRTAYRLCLEKSFLSPYYTGGEAGGPPDDEVMDALEAAHDSLVQTISNMREQMTLRSEQEAMVKFRDEERGTI
eukprot:s1789_g6.t1